MIDFREYITKSKEYNNDFVKNKITDYFNYIIELIRIDPVIDQKQKTLMINNILKIYKGKKPNYDKIYYIEKIANSLNILREHDNR